MTDFESRNPSSTAKVAGHPLHPMIVPFPIAFFFSTLITDLLYLSTDRPGFATASMFHDASRSMMAFSKAITS